MFERAQRNQNLQQFLRCLTKVQRGRVSTTRKRAVFWSVILNRICSGRDMKGYSESRAHVVTSSLLQDGQVSRTEDRKLGFCDVV